MIGGIYFFHRHWGCRLVAFGQDERLYQKRTQKGHVAGGDWPLEYAMFLLRFLIRPSG